jgi:hypothetical protein
VVAKRDSFRDLCFNVVLDSPSGSTPPGLTVPPGYGLEFASVGPASPCPVRASIPVHATGVTGSVTAIDFVGGGSSTTPAHVNVDLTLTFAPNDAGAPANETLAAQNVEVQTACQQ